MRFLLDNNLAPRLAELLRAAGHDVVHVRDIGLGSATDTVVIDEAHAQGRVLISADTNFGTLLARTHATTPSFLLIRRASGRRASDQAAIILSNLNVVQADLDAGAIVVLGEATLRIRRLPIGAPGQGG
jgi:predicted nuclease of predicted toxin-antitoxin system